MIKTHGLTHINLNVRDVKRSLRFYQQAFGMQIAFWEGNKMVFLNTPGSQDLITLCEAGESEPIAGGGVSHFGFRIQNRADLDLVAQEVERAGGRLLRRGQHAPGHPFAYVADPDGYVIEL